MTLHSATAGPAVPDRIVQLVDLYGGAAAAAAVEDFVSGDPSHRVAAREAARTALLDALRGPAPQTPRPRSGRPSRNARRRAAARARKRAADTPPATPEAGA